MGWIEFIFWIVCAVFLSLIGISFLEKPVKFVVITIIIFILTRPIF